MILKLWIVKKGNNLNIKKVVVITGGTSGIGLATVKLFNEKKWKVYAIGRKEPKEGLLPEGVSFLRGDVTNPEEMKISAKLIYETEGRVDVLISNAGFGISGPIEETSNEDAYRLMDTNFMGGFNAVKGVLPYMREVKRGRIVFTSSLAAIMPIPFQSFYSTSKAAINLFAGALDNEVKKFGVRACVVMPGDVSTGFTKAREKFKGGEAYKEMTDHAVSVMENDEKNGMKPSEIAEVIYKAATSKNPKPWYVPGFKYKVFTLLYKIFPMRFIYWLIGKIYVG